MPDWTDLAVIVVLVAMTVLSGLTGALIYDEGWRALGLRRRLPKNVLVTFNPGCGVVSSQPPFDAATAAQSFAVSTADITPKRAGVVPGGFASNRPYSISLSLEDRA